MYGYIYYFIFNLLVVSFTFTLLRLCFLGDINQKNIYQFLTKIFLSKITFILFITLTSLNYLLDSYCEVIFISLNNSFVLINSFFNKLLTSNSLSINLIDVYAYPFIYVFLLITVLSIFFCMTYNTDELLTFMFYCLVILVSGYTLFFTDSLILFFFAYEMLLIPSFFILYKFAKTRRCVEAAYLMFF